MNLKEQVLRFKEITIELEDALRHSQICETHFSVEDVPRGCAHAFALEGHLVKVKDLLNQAKVLHSNKAKG